MGQSLRRHFKQQVESGASLAAVQIIENVGFAA